MKEQVSEFNFTAMLVYLSFTSKKGNFDTEPRFQGLFSSHPCFSLSTFRIARIKYNGINSCPVVEVVSHSEFLLQNICFPRRWQRHCIPKLFSSASLYCCVAKFLIVCQVNAAGTKPLTFLYFSFIFLVYIFFLSMHDVAWHCVISDVRSRMRRNNRREHHTWSTRAKW